MRGLTALGLSCMVLKVPSREELLAVCRTAAFRDCAGYCRPRGW